MKATPFIRINEIVKGRLRDDGSIKTSLRDNITKVRMVGVITARKESQKAVPSFTFLTLDDGSAAIRIKAFGSEKRSMVRDVGVGDGVLATGEITHHRQDLYIRPLHIRELSFQMELYYRSRIILEYYMKFGRQLRKKFK